MDEPGNIELLLRNQPPVSDALFKILFATIKIAEPASKRRIAEVADISSQLVDYHIDKLVSNGQLLFDGKLYRAQAVFSDRDIYRNLTKTIISQKMLEQLAKGLDLSQKKVPDNEVLEEAILTLLRLFTIRLRDDHP